MKKFFIPTIIVVLFLLIGCNNVPPAAVVEAEVETAIPVLSTVTPTPIPPTATPKHILPTGTLTPELPAITPTAEDTSDEFIASKAEDVVGIWETQFIGDVAYMQYGADGTYNLGNSLESLEIGIAGIPGTFWFEGSEFHMKDDYGEGIYEVIVHQEVDTPTRLDFVEIDDPNSNRAGDLTAGMTWVAPAFETPAEEEFTASKVEDIVGIWETQIMGSTGYNQYKPDGTFKLAVSLENLEKGIVGIISSGTFWFENNVLHVADIYGEGTYEVTVHKEGDTPTRLDFVEIDDPDPNRAGDLMAGMTWVAPLQASELEESSSSSAAVEYLIYLPEGYEEQQGPWPLLLFLHGGGEDEPPPELVKQGGKFPFIIVAPLMDIPNWSGEVVDSVLNEVTAQYQIDEDRIYVTGLSIGGFGTWTVALAYPERFAAIAPIAGGGDPELVDESIEHLPVWVFHGAKDDDIPLERAQEMVDALEEVGGNVIFTIYSEADHDVWAETYSNPELYTWFLEHQR